jgi:hypothetical protein
MKVKNKKEYEGYQIRDENDLDEFVAKYGFDGVEIKGWKIVVIGEQKIRLEFGDFILYDEESDSFLSIKQENFHESYEICSNS